VVNQLLYVALDGALIVAAALLGARFVTAAPKSRNAWLVAGLTIACIAGALASRQDYAPLIPAPFTLEFGPFFPVLNLLRNAFAAMFMLLCHGIFREDRKLSPLLIGMVVLQLLLEEPLEWLALGRTGNTEGFWQVLAFEVLPALLQIAFVALALAWVFESGDNDLIEARRHTRRVLRVVIGVHAISALLLEKILIVLRVIPVEAMYPVHVAVAATELGIILVLLWSLTRTDVAAYIDPLVVNRPEPAPAPGTSAADVSRIRTAFERDHIYRQPGLTVAALAGHLGLPEYRLRRLIHDHLGYRNFNALLHHYRIGEVGEALADPALNGTPVLTLALSAGYQSLNPFNRAFRELKGMTPTEFRAHQKLADN
jgi:AraC-like DNA-binding protein